MSGEYGISQWHETMDEIGKIVEDAKELTIAQRIAIAQVHAILSISQELSRIYDPLACFHSTTNTLGTVTPNPRPH